MKTKKDFFISYTHADEQWATWIAAVLEAEGYACTIMAWDSRPGGNFVLYMHKALINSERFIAVLSPDYLASLYCQVEWTAAFTKDPNSEKRLFIPVRVADIEPEGLFAAIVYIDLFGTDEKTAEKRLLDGVDTKDVPRNRPSFPGTKKVRFPNSLPFNNLPYIRNNYFTGRNTILEDISKEFDTGNAVSLTQTITGLGGIGKTQTALEYVYRYADKYDWIWWIPAESEATVMKAYQDFALKMKLIKATQEDTEIICETVLTWMDTHEKWLFIYDNLDNVSDDTAWWPRNNRGNILITTRNQRLSIGKGLDISVFTEEEAVSFLEKRTGICGDPQNAALLSQRLGYLPLALEQAAAYIKKAITFPEYLLLLDNHGLTVLEEIDGVIDYKVPVTVTWEISFEKINMEGAKQLLYLCAYIASENIDSSIFSENTELLPSPLCDQLSDDLKTVKVWKELTRYSLLQKQGETQSYSMHRLLQEVVREKLHSDSKWAKYCLAFFLETFTFKYGNINSHREFTKILPHVDTFINNVVQYLTGEQEQKKISKLFEVGGIAKLRLGNYSQALDWGQKYLAICEKLMGRMHPDTVNAYNNIALAYKYLGEYDKALEYQQKALVITEKLFGNKHPNTATMYNNIALIYRIICDFSKALDYYHKALIIREGVLGKEHADTIALYHNMAGVYRSQGDYSNALALYKKVLDNAEEIKWAEHPDIATTYHNIAVVYQNQNNYTKALEWYKKAMAIYEEIFGKEHPYTVSLYNNIALVYKNQGDYKLSLEWYLKALEIDKAVLGENHPNTATVYNNIGNIFRIQGDYPYALKLLQKALFVREKVFGKEHIETASSYNNIAGVFLDQGDYLKALEIYYISLGIFEKVLGTAHPTTAIAYNNIAIVYQHQEDYNNALTWFQKAYAAFRSAFGEDHPNTKIMKENIQTLQQYFL